MDRGSLSHFIFHVEYGIIPFRKAQGGTGYAAIDGHPCHIFSSLIHCFLVNGKPINHGVCLGGNTT